MGDIIDPIPMEDIIDTIPMEDTIVVLISDIIVGMCVECSSCIRSRIASAC